MMVGFASDDRRPLSAIRPLATIPDADSELFTLTSRLCDATATRDDCRRLESLLQQDGAVDVYLAAMEVHAALDWWWHTSGSQPWRDGGVDLNDPQPPRRSVWHAIGAALRVPAAVLGFAFLAVAVMLVADWLFQPQAAVPSRPPRVAGSIAEIVAVQRPVWKEAATRLAVFDSLMPGTRLELVAGLVEIACDTGATLVVEGPASFQLTGGAAARLDRGKATVSLASQEEGGPAAAARFAVTTPSATVTDLGTAFGVIVSDDGETVVSVFDGIVDLLPHGAAAKPLRLAAGEGGGVAAAAAVATPRPPPAERFTRSVPRQQPSLEAALARAGWDAARAETLIRDSFAGEGGLAGTTPASRDGVGVVNWVAPAAWQCDRATGGLRATDRGAAYLPFRPVSGRRYLLTVRMNVSAGGIGWGAIGLAEKPLTEIYVPSHMWMLQRHETTAKPNECFAGPGLAAQAGTDRLGGSPTRSILLDTTGREWAAIFFADGGEVGRCPVPPRSSATHIVLSVFPNTAVIFHDFSVEECVPPAATKEVPR